mgnify:CR=1 FL=1
MPRWGQKIKRAILAGGENHSDLDSDAANATAAKFSEILRSKHNILGKHVILFIVVCVKTNETELSDAVLLYFSHAHLFLSSINTILICVSAS